MSKSKKKIKHILNSETSQESNKPANNSKVNSSFNFSLFKTHKLALGIIFILSTLIYSNTISHKYALDDQLAIYDNKFVTKGFDGIGDILTNDAFVGFFGDKGSKLIAGGRYRPISFVTFAMEWELFADKDSPNLSSENRGNTSVSHFVNIVIYGLLCIFIYLFLIYLFPSKNMEESNSKWNFLFTLPFVATILYAMHPIHTEVVANIKGRDELLSFLFAILSCIYFFQYFKPNLKGHITMGILFFLAVMSKENAITFIFIFPLIAYIKSIRFSSKSFYLPYFSILFVTVFFLFLRFKYTSSSISAQSLEVLNNPFAYASFNEKWATIIDSFLRYFKLLVFPYSLTHDYYYNQIPLSSFSSPNVWISILLCLGIGFILLKNLKKRNEIAFSILFFLITFSIVSNILFTVGIIMNERFIFFSSLGFSILSAFLLLKIYHQISKPIFISLIIIICSLYATKTFTRNYAWKDNFTLFGTDYLTSQNSAKVSTAYGGSLMEIVTSCKPEDSIRKRILTDSSVRVLEHAIRIYPTNSQALLLYGNAIYAKTNDKNQAIKIYQEAIRHRPNGYFDAQFNIGTLYLNANMADSALSYLENAHRINPDHPEAKISLGRAYAKLGRTSEAISLTNGVSNDLGELALNAKEGNKFEEAFQLAEQALASDPEDPKGNYVKGVCLARLYNKPLEGIPYLEKANTKVTNNYVWLEDLAVAYGISGQHKKAIPILEKVISLKPNEPNGYKNMATSYANSGNLAKAQYYMNIYQQKSQSIGK